jgi:diaminopimelate decarboxylase
MYDKYGVVLTQLDLGGGFGIKYVSSHDPVEYDKYMQKVSVTVKSTCEKRGIQLPFILIEPGRSIVGSAGITLYTVGSIKEIPNIRTYVAVDGGMADNPRYALYGAPYDAVIANRAISPRDKTVTIAGRCCESGDLIQENIAIQTPTVGDTLAVFATGAYNYSMASNYNRLPRPATIMIKDGKARVIIKRESYEDIIKNDV